MMVQLGQARQQIVSTFLDVSEVVSGFWARPFAPPMTL